jgi:hypothetical protein
MRAVSLATLLALLACGLVPSAAPEAASEDERLLQQHKIPAEGPGLLDAIRRRLPAATLDPKTYDLIEQLGDDSFFKREEASRALVDLGVPARKALQAALKHDDLEVRYRAGRCLKEIEGATAADLLSAAVRAVARSKPAGAARFLLDHLPALLSDPFLQPVAYEAREALAALAVRDGKADPALVAALADALPTVRTAAAVALARAGAFDRVPALRPLLSDPEADVRASVALALARRKHKEVIPVLIGILDEQPLPARFGAVEEVLFRLAGDKSPMLTDAGIPGRHRYRKDWERWWRDNKDAVDLSVLEAGDKPLGRTVVVLLDAHQVLDLDGEKKVRWKIDGVAMPLDVQPLGDDRVLLAEYRGNRVTERNSKGEVVWETKVAEPLTAQRLANGHTFIANKDRLLEVDRAGRPVFNYSPPGGAQIMRARKLPGGDILLITQLGVTHFHRLDRFGRPIKSFPVEVDTSGGRLDVTPAGNVLIPEMNNNRVCEYDPEGRLVRAIRAAAPIACVALPNGHVLVTLMNENRAVELNRAGKEVWEYRRDTRVSRAVRY